MSSKKEKHIITDYERSLIQSLCPLIQSKQLIKFYYKDKNSDFEDWRIVKPHLIGTRNTEEENIWLVGWFIPTQVQSLSGHKQCWKNYILNDIQKVKTIGKSYRYTEKGYNHRDSRMKNIFCYTKPNPKF